MCDISTEKLSMKINEFNIPTPWGHIAVKAWGEPSNKPVLVTHGRMDNAGSFDGLIPLLPESFYYICLDLPSHGRSSHLPLFFPIHTIDFVMVYKLVLDYFNRGKYILLGHSYGAGIGQYFTRFYPEYVEKIICIDCVVMHTVEAQDFKSYSTKRYNALFDIHEKSKSDNKPKYTEEEVIHKIRTSRINEPLSIEAAKSIAKRVLEPVGDGRYTLSTDQRMKAYFDPLQDCEYVSETMKLFPITCPYLVILAKQSPVVPKRMQGILKEIEKWEKVKIVYLDYGHDIHITHPEIVASYITEFLLPSEDTL